MSATNQTTPWPVAMPGELLDEARRTANDLGLSVSDALRLALELGLPLLRTQRAAKTDLVTTVAPWQPGELEADYASETDEGYPLKEFMAAQQWGA